LNTNVQVRPCWSTTCWVPLEGTEYVALVASPVLRSVYVTPVRRSQFEEL
jgi:hypothetical protein